MSGPGVGVESVSSSEWEAIAAMMDCVESTPAAPNQRPSSNFHSFRPASSLPATSAPPSSATSPSFAASATSGNRPHASRFQIPTGPSTQVPPPAHGARGTTASRGERPAPPAAASLTPQPAFGRPPPAASGPQLQFTSSSAPPGPSTSASPYARGAPPTRAPHVPTTTTAPPAKPKPQFENPYQKQQEEKDKSYSFSYTPGTPAAGGRSTFNRFNKNPSIFNATETAPFDDDQPPNGYDGDDDDFQASSLPPQPAQGRGPSSSSSSSSSGFTYPSPSSTPNAARGGPPQQQQQHHGNSSQQSAAMRGAGGRPPPAVAFPQPRPPTFYGNAPPVPIDVQLVDRERFGAAEPNKRDKWLSDFYASVPGSTFDACTKMWTFPLSCYTSFTKAIEDSRGVTLNGPLPPWIMRLFVYKEKKPLNMSVQLDKIPVGLLNALYPFQREGVMFALQRNGRALIADEMGLGKTLQAIAIAAYYKEDWPVLVVAPSSVRVQWADNFEKWIPGLRPDQIKVIMKTKDNPDGLVNIISYDLVVRQTNIAQKKFRVIIADESHTIKSWKAKRTSHLQPLLKDARRCILLTGTPALSRPEELFTQLHALDSQVFVRMTDFGVRYCAGHQTRFCWDYSGSSNLKELNLLLQETVMIRRLKCDVLGQLPAKKRMQVFLGIIDKHKKIIGNINDKIKEHKKMFHIAHSTDAAKSARFEAWRLIKELYHNTGTAKLPAVTEYIKEMLKTKNKIIVFAYHHDVMDGIGLLLEREGVEYVRIDGMTPPQHRQELVDYYQNQPNCRAAVLGLTSAGVGLTMTKAEAVIMTELYWNPGILRQAEDRAHRIGVEHEVEVFYLVARGTLDESIWEMIRHKLDVLGNTLNGEQEVLEAEEVEGKAPDGSTIDVFMEKILQKVETFEEREKAYQERRQQQQRDAEMMNQIIREDQQQAARLAEEAAPEPGVGFQPATIYFDAADSTLEAVDEELDEVMARVKGKTGRGVTLGRGGKVTKPPTPAAAKRKGTTAAKQHGTSAKRKLDEVEEDEAEPPLADDGVWADDDDDFEDEPAPATLPPWSAKRAPSVDERSYDNGDDDDFVSTPYGGSKISLRATPSSSSSSSRTRRTSAVASSSSSASASSTPAGAPRKRPRVVLDDEDADEDDFAAPTTAPAAFVDHEGMEEEEAEPYHDRAGAFEEEGDHDTPTTNARAAAQTSQPRGPRQLPGSFARPLGSSSTAAAPDGGGPMPRAGQLGRFSFAGGRRLANRD